MTSICLELTHYEAQQILDGLRALRLIDVSPLHGPNREAQDAIVSRLERAMLEDSVDANPDSAAVCGATPFDATVTCRLDPGHTGSHRAPFSHGTVQWP